MSKNDPFRLAINGVMTLGFVISMLISFFGFLAVLGADLVGQDAAIRGAEGHGHSVSANYRHARQRAAAHLRRGGHHRRDHRQHD